MARTFDLVAAHSGSCIALALCLVLGTGQADLRLTGENWHTETGSVGVIVAAVGCRVIPFHHVTTLGLSYGRGMYVGPLMTK
jgi:hypothetical protein